MRALYLLTLPDPVRLIDRFYSFTSSTRLYNSKRILHLATYLLTYKHQPHLLQQRRENPHNALNQQCLTPHQRRPSPSFLQHNINSPSTSTSLNPYKQQQQQQQPQQNHHLHNPSPTTTTTAPPPPTPPQSAAYSHPNGAVRRQRASSTLLLLLLLLLRLILLLRPLAISTKTTKKKKKKNERRRRKVIWPLWLTRCWSRDQCGHKLLG